MTYSSALFQDGNLTLKEAQEKKYQRIIDSLDIQPGSSLLEIGCGWGGFLEQAATLTDANILGISISKAQTDYALKRLNSNGTQDNINIKICDYRDVKGSFDNIVSIEMFEAVGEEYWDTYSEKLKELLSKNGTAILQIITIEEDRFESYRNTPDYIQRYIFPGGMLPSYSMLESTLSRAGLKIVDTLSFGDDYAKTLSHWRNQFFKHWTRATELGFDKQFQRMWEFYLVYCETGFEQKSIDVVQITRKHSE
jgi:cyclopropane-fatty-acyl-phospholipid synthase